MDSYHLKLEQLQLRASQCKDRAEAQQVLREFQKVSSNRASGS